MTLDLGAPAERFKRAGQPLPAPPVEPPVPAEQPSLSAEMFLPPVTGPSPAVYPNTRGVAGPSPSAPPRRTGGRGPRRRRWAMPGSPGERRQEPIDPPPPELHMCPFCHRKHQPVAMGGGGLADAYSRVLTGDPSRAEPIGRGPADMASLRRDAFNPWRAHPAELPLPGPTTLRERVIGWWGAPTDQQPPTGGNRPMSSAETDRKDRPVRERAVERALEQDRAGRDRLRSMADQPAPDRDQHATGTPNTGGRK